MSPERGRHLRARRRWPVRVMVLSLVLLALGSSALVSVIRGGESRITVTLLTGGVARPVQVKAPATVGAVLDAGGVVPRDGRLLSLVTKKELNPSLKPAELLINGMPAAAEAPVLAGATVAVFEPPDVAEEAVSAVDVIPAPAMPAVVTGLWHPGQPGSAVTRKGVVSGEVLELQQVQAAMPPAPVTAKVVTLTFDDGPWPTTPEVLRILREKNVKAIFCVVSGLLKREGLEMAKGALGEGHQLCNHTVTHDAKLPSKSQKVIDDEIRGANRRIVEATGVKPAFYRPPAGMMGSKIEATVKDEGQRVLLWSVDTNDYLKPAPEAIVSRVMGTVKPGAVILMHDGGGDRAATVAALPRLIDELRAAGYEMVLPDAVAPVPAAPVTPSTLPA